MKHLTRHLDRLRACLAQLPDPRRGRNRQYTMQDIGLAALSVFFMQSPSFLAHQRTLAEQRGRSNAHTLFGLTRIPCDNHIRHLLDGVPPDRFEELFQHIVEDLDAAGGLGKMRRLDGRVLIALDGTEYFRSRKISCPNCSTRARRDGATEYFHQVLAATLVAPGHAQALPLPPEFIRPQDGHGKKTLASVLVALNLLAFALHGACDLIETLWQRARQRLGSRIRMFEHLRTIACYRLFPSWTALMTLLATGSAPPQPP